MKYAVTVEYSLRRVLTVHAATKRQAEDKAVRIVEGWKDTINPIPVSIKEIGEDE